jgi:acyl-CoA thioesterase-1
MTPPPGVSGNRSMGSRPPSRGRKPVGLGQCRGLLLGVLLVVAAGIAWWAWPSQGPDVRRAANLATPGDLVVFFGDSITQGYGVRSEESFPALVGQALGVPIVNAGVPGDTMGAGLARMERDVLPHRPRLTVVEFGGNDFLRRVPVEETLRNLEAIVSALIQEGMMVVILEVNVGLGGDPYLKGYRAVADRQGAVLIPDIMRGILTSPDLMGDTIHPTAKGHRLIADRVIQVLTRLLQEANRRRGPSAATAPHFSLLGLAVVG